MVLPSEEKLDFFDTKTPVKNSSAIVPNLASELISDKLANTAQSSEAKYDNSHTLPK